MIKSKALGSIALGIGVAILSLAPVTAFAATNSPAGSSITPNVDSFRYQWEITSVSSPYDVQGAWHYGTSGTGSINAPAPVTLAQSIGVENSYTGTLEVPSSLVSATIGWTLVNSYGAQATYGPIMVPTGKTYEIAWAGVYVHRTVTQSLMQSFDYGPYEPTGTTQMLYPNKFAGFAYTTFDITNTGPIGSAIQALD